MGKTRLKLDGSSFIFVATHNSYIKDKFTAKLCLLNYMAVKYIDCTN